MYLELKLWVKDSRCGRKALGCPASSAKRAVSSVPESRCAALTISTSSCDIAYSESPAASRAFWGVA